MYSLMLSAVLLSLGEVITHYKTPNYGGFPHLFSLLLRRKMSADGWGHSVSRSMRSKDKNEAML